MIGFISAYDENEKSADKEKISFVHINSNNQEDVRIEMSRFACEFAKKFDLEKVYLFYGKDNKLIYEYSY